MQVVCSDAHTVECMAYLVWDLHHATDSKTENVKRDVKEFLGSGNRDDFIQNVRKVSLLLGPG